jgi:multidrug efflux system membrane fusion protein
VQRGQATVEKIVITSGLAAGERVITEGADRLKDGARVVLPGDPAGQRPAKGQRPGKAREQGASADAPAEAASRPRRRASQAEGT